MMDFRLDSGASRIGFLICALSALVLSACVTSGNLLENQVKTQSRAGAADPADTPQPTSNPGKSGNTKNDTEEATVEAPFLGVAGDPESASVYVNGRFSGTSPLELSLEAGYYDVEVRMEGYEDFRTSVYFDGWSYSKIDYELRRETGILNLRVDPPDSRVSAFFMRELSTGIYELPAGEHTVSISRFGYGSQKKTVAIAKNQTTSLDVSLEPIDLSLVPMIPDGAFNPREAGNLGWAKISAKPDSYGYARIRIEDRGGTCLETFEFPFIDSYDEISAKWDGRDESDAVLSEGPYRVVFESWAMRDALPSGLFPQTAPDKEIDETIEITDEIHGYSSLLALVSGMAYCPEGELLKDAMQGSISVHGTYASPGLWFGQIVLNTRCGFEDLKMEGNSAIGLALYPEQAVKFIFSLAMKGRVWEFSDSRFRTSGALYGRANFFSSGIVIDPFGAMRGFSFGLPVQVGTGAFDLCFCPEVCISPYHPNHPESVGEDIFASPWFSLPYLRGGIEYQNARGRVAASGFYRFSPLFAAEPIVGDPPFGIAVEANADDRKTGMRYGISILSQVQDSKNYYFVFGIELGMLGSTAGY